MLHLLRLRWITTLQSVEVAVYYHSCMSALSGCLPMCHHVTSGLGMPHAPYLQTVTLQMGGHLPT